MWLIIAVSVLGAVEMVRRTWRAGGPPDLGSVTERWLAEHRAHQQGRSG